MRFATPVLAVLLLASGPAARADETQEANGHSIAVTRLDPMGYRVAVDGRTLLEDTAEAIFAAIHSAVSGGGRTYVLLMEALGGTACPVRWRALDVSGVSPVLSPAFGNCAEDAVVEVAHGELRVSLPAWRAGPRLIATFKDGLFGTTELGDAEEPQRES